MFSAVAVIGVPNSVNPVIAAASSLPSRARLVGGQAPVFSGDEGVEVVASTDRSGKETFINSR